MCHRLFTFMSVQTCMTVLTFLGQKQGLLCSTEERKTGLERHEGE